MGLFDSLFASAIRKEVAAQIAAHDERLRSVEHRSAEALAGISANKRDLGLMQGAITTLDRKVTSMREQMQSDEDYVRKLAMRVVEIENTGGGSMPVKDEAQEAGGER